MILYKALSKDSVDIQLKFSSRTLDDAYALVIV